MNDLKGKTAFITGGASGIGLAMAHAFGEAGMNVMLADIEADALALAVQGLEERQIRAAGVLCDVTHRAALKEAADRTIEAFGKVHVVCNNAGVGGGGAIDQVTPADWDWVIQVNLMGVIYGMETFLPLLRAHGEGGYVLNTASMAGMVSPPGMEPYNATKFAVVALSEGWGTQLASENIGVGVLCPGFVKTKIDQSGRNRPDRFGGPADVALGIPSSLVQAGIDPARVAQRVLEAIHNNERYVFTHPAMRSAVEARFAGILAAFDTASASPALQGMDEPALPTLTPGME